MLENLAVFYHGSIYKTRPLERGLKMMFQEQPLFGGANSQYEIPAKVAVTATTFLEQKSVVFANYNRQDPADHGECSFRMSELEMPLLTFDRSALPILTIKNTQ